jgi:hypothetical protein
MDLAPYLEALRRDLTATAAPGGAEVRHAAELLTGSLDASLRLCLMEALADAAAEITTKLGGAATVDVRLRGREADLVVAEVANRPAPSVAPPADSSAAADPQALRGSDVARITLRLPEPLKEGVERAAGAEGVSVNSWLVRAISAALQGGAPPSTQERGWSFGQRLTGFAQA